MTRKTHVWLSHCHVHSSRSFLSPPPCDCSGFPSPQTPPEGAFVRLQCCIPAHFSGCYCLQPRDAEILQHTLSFDVAWQREDAPLQQWETVQGNAESRQGQHRFHHGFCAHSFSLFPSCSNYCSSAQINNCTSKPSEQMKSGLRANLSRWSSATDFKWDWDLALQPFPAFPLFTHSCAAHVQLSGSSSGFLWDEALTGTSSRSCTHNLLAFFSTHCLALALC